MPGRKGVIKVPEGRDGGHNREVSKSAVVWNVYIREKELDGA